MQLWSPTPAARSIYGIPLPSASSDSRRLRRSAIRSISLSPNVCASVIGLVTEKPWRPGRRATANDVLRVPAVHKDGRALSIAFKVGLLYGAQHEVTGI